MPTTAEVAVIAAGVAACILCVIAFPIVSVICRHLRNRESQRRRWGPANHLLAPPCYCYLTVWIELCPCLEPRCQKCLPEEKPVRISIIMNDSSASQNGYSRNSSTPQSGSSRQGAASGATAPRTRKVSSTVQLLHCRQLATYSTNHGDVTSSPGHGNVTSSLSHGDVTSSPSHGESSDDRLISSRRHVTDVTGDVTAGERKPPSSPAQITVVATSKDSDGNNSRVKMSALDHGHVNMAMIDD